MKRLTVLPVTVNMRRLRPRYKEIANPIPMTVLRRVSMPRLRFSYNGASDVRVVRQAAGDDPDSVEAQMDQPISI